MPRSRKPATIGSRWRARRTGLVSTAILLLALTSVALAGPVKGATYTGTTSHGNAAISLKVSKSGKSVTVNAPFAAIYCEGGGAGTRQITRAATISPGGSFKGSITYEFVPTHRITAHLRFAGKFSGHAVKGTARSEFPLAKQCDGSTRFSAKVK
jgi:hypothetical protein